MPPDYRLHHHPAVPGAVEDGYVPGLRHVDGEPPKVGVDLLVAHRRRHGHHVVPPRVEGTDQPLDAATLPCRVPALEDQHHRPAGLRQLQLQPGDLVGQGLQLGLVALGLQGQVRILPGVGEPGVDGLRPHLVRVLQAVDDPVDECVDHHGHAHVQVLDVHDVPRGVGRVSGRDEGHHQLVPPLLGVDVVVGQERVALEPLLPELLRHVVHGLVGDVQEHLDHDDAVADQVALRGLGQLVEVLQLAALVGHGHDAGVPRTVVDRDLAFGRLPGHVLQHVPGRLDRLRDEMCVCDAAGLHQVHELVDDASHDPPAAALEYDEDLPALVHDAPLEQGEVLGQLVRYRRCHETTYPPQR